MQRLAPLFAFFALLSAATAFAQSSDGQQLKPPPAIEPDKPQLRFTTDGDDLLVHLTIEGPAYRQAIITDYTVDDGRPGWDEPPIGVEKPRRPPRVELRYLVLVNQSLPGFDDGGLMSVPTPASERKKHQQEVVWRLINFHKNDFRKEDATFHVHRTRFAANSKQLQEALPKIKATNDEVEKRQAEAAKRVGGEAP